MLQQTTILPHCRSTQQPTSRPQHAPIPHIQRVEREISPRINMRHETRIIDRHSIPQRQQIRLREQQARVPSSPQRTVLPDRRAQRAEVQHGEVATGKQADDAVAAVAVAADTLDREEQLPALAIGAGVPVVFAGLTAAHNAPFSSCNKGEREDGLHGHDGDDDGEEEEIDG